MVWTVAVSKYSLLWPAAVEQLVGHSITDLKGEGSIPAPHQLPDRIVKRWVILFLFGNLMF